MGTPLDHDDGLLRIIDTFECGWQAGASLGGASLAQFAAVGPNLQAFWLDGYYAAQAHMADNGLSTENAEGMPPSSDQFVYPDAIDRRLLHPITRALHAAYQAAGGPPSHDYLAEILSKLDTLP
jgi:hypothetical protein